LTAVAALSILLASSAAGQQRSTSAQSVPLPDESDLARLVWSTMAAIGHANQTGNYSVLRDLGTREFQANNDAATLAGIFAEIRRLRVDLTATLTVAPSYDFQPQMVAPNAVRLRGAFNMRPTPAVASGQR
jgi:hypothetical protein